MSVAQMRSRPLSATQRDRRLWVEPAAELERILRACDVGFNTIVIGEAGVGVTSLLNQTAFTLEERGRRVVRVSAGRADTAAELLNLVVDGLENSDGAEGGDSPVRVSDTQRALRRLDESASRANPDVTVLVDEVPGGVGHDVFGRMRDELWGLGFHWLVGCREDAAAVLLTPPADAFFETIVRLPGLDNSQVIDLLARRDPEGELSEDTRGLVAERSRGNPARALALARQVMLANPQQRAELLNRDPVEDVRGRLGDPAARLFTELMLAGPSGPSDPQLLSRLGWSRPRAYQVFQTLERAGAIRSQADRSGVPGRPRKIFQVSDGLRAT